MPSFTTDSKIPSLVPVSKCLGMPLPQDVAAKATARIQAENLPPTPEVYELWYTYYSGTVPDVVRAVDILISNGQPITEKQCIEIIERMNSQGWSGATIQEAGKKVQGTIAEVGQAVTDMSLAASSYHAHLTEAEETLRTGAGVRDVEDVLKSLLAETQKMAESGAALEEVLAYSAGTIETLQETLTQARREALTDSLTGLANRKAFDHRLERLVQESQAKDALPFCLILFDIDHFKTFNDTYGHQLGDHVLRLVARALIEGIKGRDLAVRYGGEEFAVLLPSTSAHGGTIVAQALRRAVGEKDLINRISGEKLGHITLSAGVCAFTQGMDSATLVHKADEALYAAKCKGRNRVESV